MRVSLRSMLIAGVSTLAISGLAVAPVRPLPDDRVTTVAAPVELTAAVTPLSPQQVSSAMAELALPQAVGDITTANAASDFVDWVYTGILEWSDYLALELAPWALSFLPGGWIITNQIYALYWPIVQFTDSIVYDLIDPVLNDPLNLAVWANGISAVAYTAVASLLNAGINEINLVIDYFLSWLPPLPPIPPWPPFPGVAAEATVQAAVPGIIGGPLAGVADVMAGLAHTAVNLWYPPSQLVDSGVGLVSNVLDGFSFLPMVGVADFQLNEIWGLIHSQGNNAAGLANDLISVVNDLFANTLSQGLGPAVEDAYYTALLSLQNRGDVAVESLRNFALDQVQYLTGVWVPHVTSPRVDLPQGPPDEIRFSAPQLVRDILGPLAGLVPSGTVSSTPLAAPTDTPDTESQRVEALPVSDESEDVEAEAVSETDVDEDAPIETEPTDTGIDTETETEEDTAQDDESAADDGPVEDEADEAQSDTDESSEDESDKQESDDSSDKTEKSDSGSDDRTSTDSSADD